MAFQTELGKNNELPLPDELCSQLNFNIGDILLCEKRDNPQALVLSKHIDQTLSDVEIAAAGNLTRIIPLGDPEVRMDDSSIA